MLKKLACIIASVVSTVVLLTGCSKKPEDIKANLPIDVSGLSVADNLSSSELMSTVYGNLTESLHYRALTFDSIYYNDSLKLSVMKDKRIDGEEYYSHTATVNFTVESGNSSDKFYCDDGEARAVYIVGDRDRVPGKGTGIEIFASDYAGVKWGVFDSDKDPDNCVSAEDKVDKLKRFINNYADLKFELSALHDDSVYFDDNYYYFSVAIKTANTPLIYALNNSLCYGGDTLIYIMAKKIDERFVIAEQLVTEKLLCIDGDNRYAVNRKEQTLYRYDKGNYTINYKEICW